MNANYAIERPPGLPFHIKAFEAATVFLFVGNGHWAWQVFTSIYLNKCTGEMSGPDLYQSRNEGEEPLRLVVEGERDEHQREVVQQAKPERNGATRAIHSGVLLRGGQHVLTHLRESMASNMSREERADWGLNKGKE